jgi:hypothetical protein
MRATRAATRSAGTLCLGGAIREACAKARRIPAAPSAAGILASSAPFAYGLATKFRVFDVANVDVDVPLPNWLTFHMRFAVDGSGVTAA